MLIPDQAAPSSVVGCIRCSRGPIGQERTQTTIAVRVAAMVAPTRATTVVPGSSIADCNVRRRKGRIPLNAVVSRSLLDTFYPAAPKLSFTSALSASSTLNMGCGRAFMKAAMNVSGTCWMRTLKVFTESL